MKCAVSDDTGTSTLCIHKLPLLLRAVRLALNAGFAALCCCVIVRKSGFGASGVVAAARGVVLSIKHLIQKRQQQHIALQNAPGSC